VTGYLGFGNYSLLFTIKPALSIELAEASDPSDKALVSERR
jgi:hypothetical protein